MKKDREDDTSRILRSIICISFVFIGDFRPLYFCPTIPGVGDSLLRRYSRDPKEKWNMQGLTRDLFVDETFTVVRNCFFLQVIFHFVFRKDRRLTSHVIDSPSWAPLLRRYRIHSLKPLNQTHYRHHSACGHPISNLRLGELNKKRMCTHPTSLSGSILTLCLTFSNSPFNSQRHLILSARFCFEKREIPTVLSRQSSRTYLRSDKYHYCFYHFRVRVVYRNTKYSFIYSRQT